MSIMPASGVSKNLYYLGYKISHNGDQTWIGFNDMDAEGCFRWLPSRDQPEYPVTFEAWNTS